MANFPSIYTDLRTPIPLDGELIDLEIFNEDTDEVFSDSDDICHLYDKVRHVESPVSFHPRDQDDKIVVCSFLYFLYSIPFTIHFYSRCIFYYYLSGNLLM